MRRDVLHSLCPSTDRRTFYGANDRLTVVRASDTTNSSFCCCCCCPTLVYVSLGPWRDNDVMAMAHKEFYEAV